MHRRQRQKDERECCGASAPRCTTKTAEGKLGAARRELPQEVVDSMTIDTKVNPGESLTSRAKLEGNRSTGLPRGKECCPANPGSAPRLRTVLQAGLCSPPTDERQKMVTHVEQNASEPRIAPPRALRRSSHRSTARWLGEPGRSAPFLRHFGCVAAGQSR